MQIPYDLTYVDFKQAKLLEAEEEDGYQGLQGWGGRQQELVMKGHPRPHGQDEDHLRPAAQQGDDSNNASSISKYLSVCFKYLIIKNDK